MIIKKTVDIINKLAGKLQITNVVKVSNSKFYYI